MLLRRKSATEAATQIASNRRLQALNQCKLRRCGAIGYAGKNASQMRLRRAKPPVSPPLVWDSFAPIRPRRGRVQLAQSARTHRPATKNARAPRGFHSSLTFFRARAPVVARRRKRVSLAFSPAARPSHPRGRTAILPTQSDGNESAPVLCGFGSARIRSGARAGSTRAISPNAS